MSGDVIGWMGRRLDQAVDDRAALRAVEAERDALAERVGKARDLIGHTVFAELADGMIALAPDEYRKIKRAFDTLSDEMRG